MFKKDEHTIQNIIIGFACYYILLFLIAFYPATVMMTKYGSMTEEGGLWRGFVAFMITLFLMAVAGGLALTKEYIHPSLRATGWIVIVGLYVVCLVPFISIVSQVENPTYPKVGTTDIPDYNSEPLPIKVDFVYDDLWKDIFTWDPKLMWNTIKCPVVTVIVLLPISLIFKFFRKNKE